MPVLQRGTDRWPVPPTTFVGREKDLRELEDLVTAHRLVSVLGPPGIGKTRLVLEWLRSHDAQDEGAWPGGVRFCDLGDAVSAEDVVRFVAKALGVSLVAHDEKNVAHLGSTLAAWPRSVLVLDNFEHVVEHAHPFVTAWLGVAAGVHFLVTTRERLKVPGEQIFELGPLTASGDHDEGLRLFVDRARAARSSYVLAPDETQAVRDLVRELDGNPLAIELAAARTRVMTPKEILSRLPERFEVLVADRRGEPRRSALLDAIAESWDMLPAWGKTALAECSVYRGGFDLASAEAVLDLGKFEEAPPVVDVLESLCDKSLVAVDNTPARGKIRFRLHASIRAFAAQRLDDAARSGARDRHARWFSKACDAWGRALLGADAPEALAALRVDAENVTSAVRHLVAGPPSADAADRALVAAVTLAAVLASDGPFTLRASVLEQAIAFADRTTPTPALLVEALDASVLALVAIGQPAKSRANAERACTLAEAVDDALRGRAESTLALVFGMEGRDAEAVRCFEDALAHLRRAGDRLYEARALGRLAWLDWMAGRLERARARFEEAVAIHREVGDRMFEAMNGGYLAVVAHELGDVDTTEALLRHAIEEQRALGHRRIEADLTSALGSVLHEKGALDEALAEHRGALAIYRRIGHTRDEASLLCDIGRVELDRDDRAEARARFEEALPLARATQNALAIGDAEAGLGVIFARDGKLSEAADHFARARAVSPPGPRGIELVELMMGHVEVAEARAARERGDDGAANALLAQARKRLDAAVSSAGGGAVPFRETRLTILSLASALESVAPAGADAAHAEGIAEPVLRLFRTRRSILTPAGESVDLEKHPALWRLVERFVDGHVSTPGRALRVEELVAAGWPDERVRADAGARRVYTAVSTLRRRGLRAWIVKQDDGYRLADALRVVCA